MGLPYRRKKHRAVADPDAAFPEGLFSADSADGECLLKRRKTSASQRAESLRRIRHRERVDAARRLDDELITCRQLRKRHHIADFAYFTSLHAQSLYLQDSRIAYANDLARHGPRIPFPRSVENAGRIPDKRLLNCPSSGNPDVRWSGSPDD